MVEPGQRRPIVTIAALYGSAGSVIGPRVAERLDVEFLDRGIPRAVAEATGWPESAVAQVVADDAATPLGRLTSRIGRLPTLSGEAGGATERLDIQERTLRRHIEELVARTRVTGGVVLGHGGMVVLRSVPWALHVNLYGPEDARAHQATKIYDIDLETARQRQRVADRSRRNQAARVYGIDLSDRFLYHLLLDSTALSIEACVDLIAQAAAARLAGENGGAR